jgi:hypothetical protein
MTLTVTQYELLPYCSVMCGGKVEGLRYFVDRTVLPVPERRVTAKMLATL